MSLPSVVADIEASHDSQMMQIRQLLGDFVTAGRTEGSCAAPYAEHSLI